MSIVHPPSSAQIGFLPDRTAHILHRAVVVTDGPSLQGYLDFHRIDGWSPHDVVRFKSSSTPAQPSPDYESESY